MKKIALVLALMVTGQVFAQAGKIEDAALYLSEQNYEQTILSARQGLTTPELKPRLVAKGGKILAQGIIYAFSEANNPKSPNKAQYEKFIAGQKDILLEAYNALVKAEQADVNKMFTEEIQTAYTQLINMLLNTGYNMFREGKSKESLPYLNAVVDIMKRIKQPFHTAYQVRGYINMELKDSTQALDDFLAAINVYNQPPAAGAKPKEADKSVATVYGQAILLKKWKKEYEQAMALLAEAQQKFPGNDDLKRYEIILFQNPSPEFYDIAISRFEKLTTENPRDTTSLLVYATLLEKKDTDKAIATYKKLLELQPNNLTAIFNVGALYNNKAKDVTDQYNNLIAAKSKDNAQLEALERQIDESFRAALPYFELAHKLEPENETVLTVLIQITGNLKMMDSTEQYMAKRKALRGY